MEQPAKQRPGSEIIPTPVWVLVVRIFQIIFSFVVVGCCGAFLHWLYADQLAFAVVCCLFTWIISMYNILAEKVRGCRRAYNVYATLALDLLMIIFWLAAMGAMAQYRGKFKYDVQASCTSNGSVLGSGECVVSKRAATAVATKSALNLVAGSAGVAAIIMLLYVASFAYVCHFWRISRARGGVVDTEKLNTDMNSGLAPQQGYQAEPHGYAQSHQVSGQYYQPQDVYAQQPQYQQPATTAYDPYTSQQVNTHYSGASGQQTQPVYSTHSTPVPGHMYQPPPQ